jgi:hypothetical protein
MRPGDHLVLPVSHVVLETATNHMSQSSTLGFQNQFWVIDEEEALTDGRDRIVPFYGS